MERQRARVTSADFSLTASAQDVALRTAEVYLEVLRRTELVALARENREAHQQTYDQIKLRSTSGVGRMADLDQVTGRLALAIANVISEESNLMDARTNYRQVTGEPAVTLVYPEDDLNRVPLTIDGAAERAIVAHPTLKSAEADVVAAQAQNRASRNPMYPRFDLEIGSSWNDNLDGQRGNNRDQTLMLRMQYNLFNSGGDSARMRQTSHLVNEARDVRERARREVEESVRLSWNQFNAADAQLSYLDQHVDASRRTLEAYNKQFNIGKRSLLDLLDSKNELFEASRSYVNGRFDRTLALYRVRAGMGDLPAVLGLGAPDDVQARYSAP